MSFDWFLVPVLASDAEGIWVLIPLAAIVMVSLTAIVKVVISHRERMAKIGMGFDPDHDPTNPQASSPRRPHDPTSQVGG